MIMNRGVAAIPFSDAQPIACLEYPPDTEYARDQEPGGHRKAQANGHIGIAVKTPAKTADQIDDRVK
jgi:hypothetical protein